MPIKRLFNYLWNSPTLTSWASILARGGNTLLILPLVLNKFNEESVNVYLLLQVIFSFKDIFDFGFLNNIARFYSYTLGGAINFRNLFKNKSSNKVNFEILTSLKNITSSIYNVLAVACLVFVTFIGSLAVKTPIMEANESEYLWYAWAFQIISMSFWIYGNKFTTMLLGFNQVALIKRWDTIFSIFQIVSSIMVVLIFSSISLLIMIINFWNLMIVFRNYFLAKKFLNSWITLGNKKLFYNKYIKAVLYPRAVKDFLAGLLSFGVAQAMGVIYANIASPGNSSSYLLAVRISDQVKQISRAPFYSKIPYFAKGIISDKINIVNKIKLAQNLSYAVLIAIILVVFMSADFILNIMNSDTSFVKDNLWLIMSISILIERFTSMHNQLFVIMKNEIISHKGLLVTGIVNITFVWLLFPTIDVFAFPLGIITGYSSFYAWFVAGKNYSILNSSFFKFEKKGFIPSLFALMCILFMINFI